MDLSLSEAAIALGQSERQVRYLIKTGRLAARKGEGGRWRIESQSLPLSDGQRQAMAERAAAARQGGGDGFAAGAALRGYVGAREWRQTATVEAWRCSGCWVSLRSTQPTGTAWVVGWVRRVLCAVTQQPGGT